MKRLSILLCLAAACAVQVSCNATPDPTWPPSPPPTKESGHKPWGDNWATKTR